MSSLIKTQINKLTKIPVTKIEFRSFSVKFDAKNVVDYQIYSICKTSTKRVIRALNLSTSEIYNPDNFNFEKRKEELNDSNFWINYYSNLLKDDFSQSQFESYIHSFHKELSNNIPHFSQPELNQMEKNFAMLLQKKFTNEIYYTGQNGHHYSKICEPKLNEISVQYQILFSAFNSLKFSINGMPEYKEYVFEYHGSNANKNPRNLEIKKQMYCIQCNELIHKRSFWEKLFFKNKHIHRFNHLRLTEKS